MFSRASQRLASRDPLGPGTAWIRRMFLLSLLLSILPRALGDQSPQPVIFILSGDSSVYTEVADATQRHILKECKPEKFACSQLSFNRQSVDDIVFSTLQQSFITIAYGTKASNWLKESSFLGSQLYAMLPQPLEQAAPEIDKPGLIARIYIDQPYSRYFDLIRVTIPRAGRIGLLVHESNLDLADRLSRTAEESGFQLKIGVVSSDRDVGESLSHLLTDIDVLLALPDSRIHNSNTISHILTTAYRNNIPVIGFSSAYVKAGATAAVFTSLDDIARQVSDTLLDYLYHGQHTQSTQRADYFSVSFNFEVARSLGLVPVSSSDIKKLILERER